MQTKISTFRFADDSRYETSSRMGTSTAGQLTVQLELQQVSKDDGDTVRMDDSSGYRQHELTDDKAGSSTEDVVRQGETVAVVTPARLEAGETESELEDERDREFTRQI